MDTIRNARKRAGLTQAQLAEHIGMDQSAISRVERGQRRLSVAQLIAIAQALGVPARALLGETDAKAA